MFLGRSDTDKIFYGRYILSPARVGGWEKLNTKDAMQKIMRNAINNIKRIYTYTRIGKDIHKQRKIKTETRTHTK